MLNKLLDLQERSLGRRLGSDEMALMEILRTEAGRELTIRTAIARPDRHRVTVERTGRVLYSEGYDGETAWDSEDNGPARAVLNSLAAATRRRYGVWLAGRRSLKELVALGVDLRLVADEKDALGRCLPALRLRFDEFVSKLLFLDADTGQILVEREELAVADPEHQALELHTTQSTEIAGMCFPRSQRVIEVDTGKAVAELAWVSVDIVKPREDYLAPLRN